MNKKQVIEKIGKAQWKAFERFMTGQTVALNKDGTLDYYEWDVENPKTDSLIKQKVRPSTKLLIILCFFSIFCELRGTEVPRVTGGRRL